MAFKISVIVIGADSASNCSLVTLGRWRLSRNCSISAAGLGETCLGSFVSL